MTAFFKYLKLVNDDFTCAFCNKICVKPLTFSVCGHSVCCECYDEKNTFFCPDCGADIRKSDKIKLVNLENAIKPLQGILDCYKQELQVFELANLEESSDTTIGRGPLRKRNVKTSTKSSNKENIVSVETIENKEKNTPPGNSISIDSELKSCSLNNSSQGKQIANQSESEIHHDSMSGKVVDSTEGKKMLMDKNEGNIKKVLEEECKKEVSINAIRKYTKKRTNSEKSDQSNIESEIKLAKQAPIKSKKGASKQKILRSISTDENFTPKACKEDSKKGYISESDSKVKANTRKRNASEKSSSVEIAENFKDESIKEDSVKRGLRKHKISEKADSIIISGSKSNSRQRKNSERSNSKLNTSSVVELDTISDASFSKDKSTVIEKQTSIKSLEKKNTKGETILHVACRVGNIDKARELLQKGANPNTKDNAGWTPLHEAVQAGRLDLVLLLLDFRTLSDTPGCFNETPLHEAVRYGHIDIAEALTKHGADIDARNSKGETPLTLAQGKIKETLLEAGENLIKTQTDNVLEITSTEIELLSDNIHVYCISEFKTVLMKLQKLAKHHKNLHVEQKFSKKVTHLVVDTEDDGTCVRRLEVLQGITFGIWILRWDWVTKSTDLILEHFERYEVTGIGNQNICGPRNSRFNRYKQLPGLFNGCHFYLHNFTTKCEISKNLVLTKAVLSKLITDLEGKVLRRMPNPEAIDDSERTVPYHAKNTLAKCSHFIIFRDFFEPMYNMSHLKALPVAWLIDCIEKFELVDP